MKSDSTKTTSRRATATPSPESASPRRAPDQVRRQAPRQARAATDARPIVKWAGGKTGLLHHLRRHVGERPIDRYVEPFAGGAALFFALASSRPKPFSRATLNDQNAELVACYRAVRDDVEGLIVELRRYTYDRELFYRVRDVVTSGQTDVQRGGRLIFLNKTCFNGLWRVNSKGAFNVPFGTFANPRILDEKTLRAASRALRRVTLKCGDFEEVTAELGQGDFVYFDPPYVPASRTASFTAYARGGFSHEEQERLALVLASLKSRGVRAMLSNADTPETRRLYKKFRVYIVEARRSINSDSTKRGASREVIVTNWESRGLREGDP